MQLTAEQWRLVLKALAHEGWLLRDSTNPDIEREGHEMAAIAKLIEERTGVRLGYF